MVIVAETQRLVLRHFQHADFEPLALVFGDPEVMHYGTGVKDGEWIRQWLCRCQENYTNRGFGLWAVSAKQSLAVMGYCGLSRFADVGGQPEKEIGYRLARKYWGRGFATEAAVAVRDYGFKDLNLVRLISIIDPRNTASIGVATKVGMSFEKEVMFQGFLDHVYAIRRAVDQ